MAEMIERVARAIKVEMGKAFDAKPLPGPGSADDWSATGGVLNLEDVASAAIAAMREPTEAMMQMAGIAHQRCPNECHILIGRAMIDEALK